METEAQVHHSVHIPQWKRDEIRKIVEGIGKHKSAGIVDVHGVPSNSLQKMRESLRVKIEMRMVRNTLATIALDSIPKDQKAHELTKYVDGQMVMVYTDLNAFKLYKLLESTKSKRTAKGGDTAPGDIVVPKGPTSFKPGPLVGELQQVGIPAGIEGGKVVIKDTKTVVRKGEKISAKLAEMLTRLEIKPIDVGLNLKAVVEGHTLYLPSDLSMDEDMLRTQFARAAREAMSLSMEAGYTTKETMVPLIQKAAMESKALAVNAPIFEKSVMDLILSKAEAEMLAVAKKVAGKENALDEELKNKVK
jgi:large subunit ribosomal protein L10